MRSGTRFGGHAAVFVALVLTAAACGSDTGPTDRHGADAGADLPGGDTSGLDVIALNGGVSSGSSGRVVSISQDGSTIVVGDAFHDINGFRHENQGALHILQRVDGGWSEQLVVAADAEESDYFGTSVDISDDGTRIVASAGGAGGDSSAFGAVYVLTQDLTQDGADGWSQTRIDPADQKAAGRWFGHNVAISGDGSTALVGAPYAPTDGNLSKGAVYVLRQDAAGTWSEERLTQGTNRNTGWFGYAVDIDEDGSTLAVGAPYGGAEDARVWSSTGIVYVYVDGPDGWERSEVLPSDASDGDFFGNSVAISDDGSSLAAGAIQEGDTRDASTRGAGFVYLAASSVDGWSGERITLEGGAAGDEFGKFVAVSGDGRTVVSGAPGSQSGGAVALMSTGGGDWTVELVTDPAGSKDDGFGEVVALSGDGSLLAIAAGSKWTGTHWGQLYTKALEQTPPMQTPTDLAAEVADDGTVTLTWSLPEPDRTSSVAVAVVSQTSLVEELLFEGSVEQVEIEGLAAGDYQAVVIAVESDDVSSDVTDPPLEFSVPLLPPGSPSNATATVADSPWQIDTSHRHTCARYADGQVACWGLGQYGRLGSGNETDVGGAAGQMGDNLAAVPLGTDVTVQSVQTGEHHSCAILGDGSVKCWGANTYGELGLGDTDRRGDGTGAMGDDLPVVQLGSGRSVTTLALGDYHACGILDDASLKCWGQSYAGQLGLGDEASHGEEDDMGDALPVVQLGEGRTAIAVGGGRKHTCVVLDDASVKCWGENTVGQLGLGDTDDRGDEGGEMGDHLPAVALGTGRTALSVTAGDDHTCALLDGGSVKCWGGNSEGQLGLGDTDDRGDEADEMGDRLEPVALGTGRTALSVTAGDDHTCALLDGGSVKCWGDNSEGQLGLGHMDSHGDADGGMGDDLPAVDLGTGRTAVAVTAGAWRTCAVLDDESVKCWGNNNGGELGIGDTGDRGDHAGEMGDDLPAISLPFVATDDLTRTVALSWEAPAGGGPATGYTVTFTPAGGAAQVQEVSGSRTSVVLLGVRSGDHSWSVVAGNSAGSGVAATGTVTVSADRPGQVAARLYAAGDQEVALSLEPPTDTGGSTLADYMVEVSSDGSSWERSTATLSRLGLWVVGDLQNDVPVQLRVAARNIAAGVEPGPWADPVAAIPFQGYGAWTAASSFVAADGADGDEFGVSVALSADGTVLAVGAEEDDDHRGSVYVYRDDDGTWSDPVKLTPGSAREGDFGNAVALSADGNLLVVGADEDDNERGAAYVFVADGSGGWLTPTRLVASDAVAGDELGESIDVAGDGSVIVVGAPYVENNRGAAYVFVPDGSGGWRQVQLLFAHDRHPGANFGETVSVSGDGSLIVVGAPWTDVEDVSAAGSAYVFTGDPDAGWSQATVLKTSPLMQNPAFGKRVAVSADGSTIVVSAINRGIALVYQTDDSGSWAEVATLTAQPTDDSNVFGVSVAVNADGSLIVVGDDEAEAEGLDDPGMAHVFRKVGEAWVAAGRFVAANASDEAEFGFAGAISDDGSTIAVGGDSGSVAGAGEPGYAWVYRNPLVDYPSAEEPAVEVATAFDGSSAAEGCERTVFDDGSYRDACADGTGQERYAGGFGYSWATGAEGCRTDSFSDGAVSVSCPDGSGSYLGSDGTSSSWGVEPETGCWFSRGDFGDSLSCPDGSGSMTDETGTQTTWTVDPATGCTVTTNADGSGDEACPDGTWRAFDAVGTDTTESSTPPEADDEVVEDAAQEAAPEPEQVAVEASDVFLPPEPDEPVAEEPEPEPDEPVAEEPEPEPDEPVAEEPEPDAEEPEPDEPVAEEPEPDEPVAEEPDEPVTTTTVPVDDGSVVTGYTAEELAWVANAASQMNLSVAEFQATGVWVIDFLTQMAGGDPEPLAEPPVPIGSENVAYTWDDDELEVIDRVADGYGITRAEAQKFGAFLLAYFVGLGGG